MTRPSPSGVGHAPRAALLGRAPLAALWLALGCATSRGAGPPAAPAEIRVEEPAVIEATRPEDADLLARNDEELAAIGHAAFQAGDLARAAAAFARLADAFPASLHRPTALYHAGLAYRQLERWEAARDRFRQLAEGFTGPDADEARFLEAEALYRLGRHPEARATLDVLAARADLDPARRVRALTERGVVELEDGDPDGAERSLSAALQAHEAAGVRERAPADDAAKARYWMGEVQRARFLSVTLSPADGDEAALSAALERKAQLLLAGQGSYLRAIQTGDPTFAVAAAARVGELYDSFHAELTSAPLPPGLDEEQARAYREELRSQVRVLVEKAIVAYEETLAAARRAGVESAFVPRTQAALERMRGALGEQP